jgi:hypothetical protein
MFLTLHACSYCGRQSAWSLAVGHGDQLKTERPKAVWIGAFCVSDAIAPVRPQPKAARCDSCGWRRIGKREVITHLFSGSLRAVGGRIQIDVVRAKAMLVRGDRIACNYCVDEARRVLASPWIRLGRIRWPSADILGDGPFAVVGCGERRVQLWRVRHCAEQTRMQSDALLCGAECALAVTNWKNFKSRGPSNRRCTRRLRRCR